MKRSPLLRRTPLRRRSERRRHVVVAQCVNTWCRRPRRVGEFCGPCAAQRADTIFSKLVRARDGRCIVADWFPDLDCGGRLECSHLLRRGYAKALRWDLDNAVTSCADHHGFTQTHPKEWRLACYANGHDLTELHRRGQALTRPYLPDVIEGLLARSGVMPDTDAA